MVLKIPQKKSSIPGYKTVTTDRNFGSFDWI